jgi:phosphatidylglycerophosphatase A
MGSGSGADNAFGRSSRSFSDRSALFVATFAYVGFFPFAPGTAGSAAALPLYAVIQWSGSKTVEAVAIGLVVLAGVWAATGAERRLGGHDPGPVVIDEVAGMLVTLAFLPFSWTLALVGFFLFRLFDVFKPYPAGRLERLPAGWGVMADDLMAAVYANLLLRSSIWIWPGWFS